MGEFVIDEELNYIEDVRINASIAVREKRQKLNEQYFTPGYVSKYIGEVLIGKGLHKYNILDAASGVGNLGAFVALSIRHSCQNANIHISSVEVDHDLSEENHIMYDNLLKKHRINFDAINSDFFNFYDSVYKKGVKYSKIVMNPPYRKLSRKEFDSYGFDKNEVEYSPNLYSVFISCGLNLLDDDGELIAIVPRSFCSGVQFKNFRKKILEGFNLDYIHLFDSRTKVFSFDKIQQETVILKVSKRCTKSEMVEITFGDDLMNVKSKSFPLCKVVFPQDIFSVIHIPHDELDDGVLEEIFSYKNNLDSLGLTVSTGKVVDFRCASELSLDNSSGEAYLFCKENLGKDVFWLDSSKKPNYLKVNNNTKKMLLDNQCHIVINRMFFKERVPAVISHIVDLTDTVQKMAVENHLNYISGKSGSKLSYKIAVGVKKYLESEMVTLYLKRFIGSTQINASDLKSLPFPSKRQLLKLAEL